jgi:hypothetical protein
MNKPNNKAIRQIGRTALDLPPAVEGLDQIKYSDFTDRFYLSIAYLRFLVAFRPSQSILPGVISDDQ